MHFCSYQLTGHRAEKAKSLYSQRRAALHRAQSEKFGTRIFSETVTRVDLSQRPFRVWTSEKEVAADTIIVATGAARQASQDGSHLQLLP